MTSKASLTFNMLCRSHIPLVGHYYTTSGYKCLLYFLKILKMLQQSISFPSQSHCFTKLADNSSTFLPKHWHVLLGMFSNSWPLQKLVEAIWAKVKQSRSRFVEYYFINACLSSIYECAYQMSRPVEQ